jgi:hypothetical protein
VYEIEGPFRLPPQGRPGGAGRDTDEPRLRVGARERVRIGKLLRRGVSIRLELDEAAGVEAILKVPVRRDGRRRHVTVARAAPRVAVVGDVSLRLRPSDRARRVLRGRRRIAARLNVVATDAAGNRAVESRSLELVRAPAADHR